MKKYIKHSIIIFSLLIGLFLIIWLYDHFGLRDIWFQFKKIQLWQWLLVFILTILILFFKTLRLKFIIEDVISRKIPFKTYLKSRLVEFTISYLLPTVIGGELPQAYVLKKDAGVPVMKGLFSALIEKIIDALSFFVLIFFTGIFLLIGGKSFFGWLILILTLALFLILYFLMELVGVDKLLLFLSKILGLNKVKYKSDVVGKTSVGERITTLGKEASVYLRRRGTRLYWTIIFTLISFVFWFLQAYVVLSAMGLRIQIDEILIVKILTLLSTFSPIPADIGAFEGAYVVSFGLINLPVQAAIALSIVMRFFDFILIIIGIFIIIHYTRKLVFNFAGLLEKGDENNGVNANGVNESFEEKEL